MPELPIGKMYPTLVAVQNRFVFQIGGFDDYDFDIYCLDTQELEKGWIEIKLDLNIKVARSSINQKHLFENVLRGGSEWGRVAPLRTKSVKKYVATSLS